MTSLALVAGDPSGDAHAARLIHALKAKNPSLAFSGLGGPAMQQAGMELLDDLTQAASIGPFDATRHLSRFVRAKRLFDAHLARQRPSLVILVDFGDFNLPVIAPLAKRHGIPVAYYISPQLWAWGRFRLRYVRRYVDRMIVFFPFEQSFYERAGVPVTWVGHPLLDEAPSALGRDEAVARFKLNPWRRTVGLLPGSREDEVRRHLPLMAAVAREISWHMPGVQFLLPRAPAIERSSLDVALAKSGVDARVAEGPMSDALRAMEAAVVASGTATLQTALHEVPMAVVYRTSWPTYLAVRSVLRVPHIALVNIVAGREAVPEFVQHRANPKRIAQEIVGLLRDEARAAQMRASLQDVRARLGEPGAVGRAADAVLGVLAAHSSGK